jgi:hypothetical protein
MQKLITLSIVDSKNSLVLQYDLNIYATLAKICQAATFLAHVEINKFNEQLKGPSIHKVTRKIPILIPKDGSILMREAHDSHTQFFQFLSNLTKFNF